jgi:hypothetical protein
MTLATYEGHVTDGIIQLKGNPSLPEDARLIVVVSETTPWAERGLSEADWQAAFAELRHTIQSATLAPLEDRPLTEEEINASVHAVRETRRAYRAD